MIEKTILDYLTENLDVEVFMEMPRKPLAKSFVVIERTGRRVNDKITTSMFAFQSYGESLIDAAQLNEQVESVVDTLINLDEVTRAELNSSYNFTDTSTKQYRYQCVYDVTHY